MSNFPSLQPALTALVTIDAPISIGSSSRGTPLNIAPMTKITLKSEPGFSPEVDASSVGQGNDYIHNDPDGKHMRLNAHGQVKDKSGAMIHLNYTGIIAMTPELGAVLTGKEDAKSTEFGDVFIEMRFETGDEKLRSLETSVYLGAGRFVVEKDKPVVVEYKLSKAIKGN